jgi:hypothetical protein
MGQGLKNWHTGVFGHRKVYRGMAHSQTPTPLTRTYELPHSAVSQQGQKTPYPSNCATAVTFILRGAKKRRTLARQRCHLIQEALGVGPEDSSATLIKP